MKKHILACSFLLAAIASPAQMLYNWNNSLGAGLNDLGKCIANPVNNTLTSSGVFRSTVFFNPPGGAPRTATGASADMYVIQHSGTGLLNWVVQVSGNVTEEPTNMVSDAGGNTYVIGYFNSSPSDFDPATLGGTVTTAGGNDIFVVKYSIGGAFQWVRRFGGTGNDQGFGISFNQANGELLISGLYTGAVAFDAFILPASGGTDGFFARINAATGAVIGAYNIGGAGNDAALGVCSDAAGNIYTTGYYTAGADFDPGVPSFTLGTFGLTDIFVARYASTGAFSWANGAGTPNDDHGNDIVQYGNYAFITGYAGLGLATFGALSWTVAGTGSDAFVAAFATTGGASIISPITGPENDNGLNIASDQNGYIEVTGDFNSGILTLDNKAGGAILPVNNFTAIGGVSDFFIARYNTSMIFKTGQAIGGSGRESCPGLSVDPSSHDVYVTGNYENTVDFDPGVPVANRTSAGGRDIFIQKFNWVAPIRMANPANENFSIYPNPGNGLFTIAGLTENATIEIYSSEGRLVNSETNGINNRMDVDISELENGMYIVRIVSADGSVRNERIILQH